MQILPLPGRPGPRAAHRIMTRERAARITFEDDKKITYHRAALSSPILIVWMGRVEMS